MTKLWETVVSAVLVRLICFVATAVTLPVLTLLFLGLSSGRPTTVSQAEANAYPYHVTVLSPFPGSPYWLAVVAASVFAAFYVPWRRRKRRECATRRLDVVRDASRKPGEPGAPPAPIATVRRDDP